MSFLTGKFGLLLIASVTLNIPRILSLVYAQWRLGSRCRHCGPYVYCVLLWIVCPAFVFDSFSSCWHKFFLGREI